MTRRFTTIKGLSQVRRLPRLGKIRLGVRVKKRQPDKRCKHDPTGICNFCSYPRETPHFIVPDNVAKVYGAEPLELDIMIPVEDRGVSFPQAYEMYGSGRGLKCTGDGETAMRFDEETKAIQTVQCPCDFYERGLCSQRAHLNVILPRVSVGGIFQIDTGSFHSIVDLNSSLDYVQALVGRVALVPVKLKRAPRETFHDGKRSTHYTLRVELEGDTAFLNTLRENTARILAGPTYALPAPVLENPAIDPEGTTVFEEQPEVTGEAAAGPAMTGEFISAGAAGATEAPAPRVQVPAGAVEAGGAGDLGFDLGELVAMVQRAQNADEVNEALDLGKDALNPEDRAQLKRVAAGRIKALREES